MSYTRRQFFTRFGQSMLGRVAPSASAPQPPVMQPESQAVARKWVRPPGALEADAFRKACTGCTDCLDACPYHAIRRLGPEFGVDACMPAIIPLESPCYLCADMPCIAACTTGALLPATPGEVRMGTAVLEKEVCYLASGQPCDYCTSRCPLKSDAIALGEDGLPVIHDGGCAGCGVCAYLCPADALAVVPR